MRRSLFCTDETLPHKKARKILGLSSGTKGEKNELLHTDYICPEQKLRSTTLSAQFVLSGNNSNARHCHRECPNPRHATQYNNSISRRTEPAEQHSGCSYRSFGRHHPERHRHQPGYRRAIPSFMGG